MRHFSPFPPMKAIQILVDIRDEGCGMFSATSPNEPDLCVVAEGDEGITAAITIALEVLFAKRLGRAVVAVPFQAENELADQDEEPWAVVPKELIAARAAAGCF